MLRKSSHRITTASAPAEPVLFSTNQDVGAGSVSSWKKPCLVCHANQARYTCPKCHVPYCSVKCYHAHGQKNEAAASCTESFYHGRVSQVMELEVKEKKDDMLGILSRVHELNNQDHQDPVHLDESSCTPIENPLSEEELVRLLRILEDCQDDATKLEVQLSTLPLRVRNIVHGLFQHSNRLSDLQEWVLEPWHPWWRIELGDEKEDDCESIAIEDDEISISKKSTKTLDEKMLGVPSFELLMRPRNGNLQSPPLLFNLVDILYRIVWTLRLYHGLDNASDVIACEALETMARASTVLSASVDSCFCFTSLAEVMVDCTRRSTTFYSTPDTGECNAPWQVLSQDVALICQSHRTVARALFESVDIAKAAVRGAKKESVREEALSQMRKTRKKLEFYLSWHLSHKDEVMSLSTEIEEWIACWTEE